jgi:hypothetical protein
VRLTNSTVTTNAAWFDLQNGLVGTVIGAGNTASIEFVGNGWYKCVLVVTGTNYVNNGGFAVAITNGDGVTTGYTGNNTDGLYLWGADLRVANDGVNLPNYQRVGAATNYTTTGFPPYLAFDGTDDCLFTASTVDFTATDEMTVCVGTRSTALLPNVLVELSVSPVDVNGAFGFVANPGSNAYNTVASRGTTPVTLNTPAGSFTAPQTSVQAMLADVSTPNLVARKNGTQIAQNNTSSQGTGNYGNHTLFVGARNNASNRLNGRIYGLIVRGATTATATLEQTETWMNGKTKAF